MLRKGHHNLGRWLHTFRLADIILYDNVITFAAYYYRVESFDARVLGCDALVGRIRREFEKSLPTMFPLARVRSLAISQKARVSEKDSHR